MTDIFPIFAVLQLEKAMTVTFFKFSVILKLVTAHQMTAFATICMLNEIHFAYK